MREALPYIAGFVAGMTDGETVIENGQFLFSLEGSYVLVRAVPPRIFDNIELVLSGIVSKSFVRISPECFGFPASIVMELLVHVRDDIFNMINGKVVQKHYKHQESKIISL